MPRLPYPRRVLVAAAVLAAAFAVLAWVVLARHGTPYPVDTGPHRWSVRHRPHGWVSAARVVTHLGTGPYPYVAAAVGGWLGGSRGRVARAGAGVPVALLAVLALVAEQSVRTSLMLALHRPRPPAADWAVAVSGHSFPSGHTASSAVAAGLLAWGLLRARPGALGRTLAAVCVAAAVAVGCSRVYLGVHWPTDVVGGWLYAGCWLLLVLPLLTAYARRSDGADGGFDDRPPGSGEPPE
jgi:undecaprenyl-diphosphatase